MLPLLHSVCTLENHSAIYTPRDHYLLAMIDRAECTYVLCIHVNVVARVQQSGKTVSKRKASNLIAIVVGRGEPCKCTLETMRESSCLAIPMVRMRQSNHLSLHRNDHHLKCSPFGAVSLSLSFRGQTVYMSERGGVNVSSRTPHFWPCTSALLDDS